MSYTVFPLARVSDAAFMSRAIKSGDPDYARLKSTMLPNTTDWYGRWRTGSNLANDFEIDREMQKRNRGNNGYTGIVGNIQDMAVTESMGPIYNRSAEHLGSSDVMIIRTRRRLLEAAKRFTEDGVAPPGVENRTSTWSVRRTC